MSKILTVKIGHEEVVTAVVNKDYLLERVLKSLFSVIDKKHDENRKFERVVGLCIEKSFSSDYLLERVLKSLFSVIDKKHDENRKFERVVGLCIEKSFSSRAVDEKVAVLELCVWKFLRSCPPFALQIHKFLDLSDIMVVGVGIKQTLCDLQRDYGIRCRNVVVDLADLASVVIKYHSAGSAYTFVDLYKIYFHNDFIATSLAKSADVAFW
jgi:hypothetical protein